MNNFFLAILSGLLLAFSWPAIGIYPLIFIAFVPLLILENTVTDSRQVFWYSFLAFLIFNVFTTYWVYYATPLGSIAAFLVNSALMAVVFLFFHKINSLSSNRLGYFSLIFIWIAMEYFQLQWDLSWPWLTIGNVFASFPMLVQWYELTGFLGGSFWVILINIIFFMLFKYENKKRMAWLLILFLFLPILISFYMYFNFKEMKDESINVLIVQPNVDPYNEKFNLGYQQQLADLISLARDGLTQETNLLLAPETALVEGIWENRLEQTLSIKAFRDLQNHFPNLNILVGATTYKILEHEDQRTNTARQIRNEDVFYDVYNSAVFIPDSGHVEVYHKTKLVPGAEKMPFPYILDPLARLIVNLGGTSGSLGSGNYLNSFLVDSRLVSPLICYESVYGEMGLGETNLLAIITNDGWWGETAGYRQHFQYARLRAVEQRKSIIRSANTGISGIINARGNVIRSSNWSESIYIGSEVPISNHATFYSLFGDYIGRICAFLTFLLFLLSIVNVKLRS